MKLINNLDSEIFLAEKEYPNTIYKKEIFELQERLQEILNIYNDFCIELTGQANFLSFNRKNTLIRKKKLEKLIDLKKLESEIQINDNLLAIYRDNIINNDNVAVDSLHTIIREVIKEYYDAINIVRFARKYKDNNGNPLFDLYFENERNYTPASNLSISSINLIKEKSVKQTCYELVKDYYAKIDEYQELKKEMNDNQRRLEKFLQHERRNIDTLEELRWYKEFLYTCCINIEEKDKQKRIN